MTTNTAPLWSRGESTQAQNIDRAISDVASAVQGAAEAGKAVVESGRDAMQGVQQVVGRFGEALDVSVRQQPLPTLAIALVAGFAVGALWRAV